MRTIVRDHNKTKLEEKVEKMVDDGWEKKSEILLDDKGFSFTYLCVMQTEDKPNNGRTKFNNWIV